MSKFACCMTPYSDGHPSGEIRYCNVYVYLDGVHWPGAFSLKKEEPIRARVYEFVYRIKVTYK